MQKGSEIMGNALASPTGATLLVREWAPTVPARAVVVVLHGLAEHSGRYERFGRELAAAGFSALAHDHRGHGGTRAPDAPPRRFAAREGAEAVLADAEAVLIEAARRWPTLPLFVFGHSLGGLVALALARRIGPSLAGCAAWNMTAETGPALALGRIALRLERMLKGSDIASEVFAGATFRAWARQVPERRSEEDWLSHDPAEVDRYRADPLCGWTPTVSMAGDVLALVRLAAGAAGRDALSPDLPLHLLGGTGDPATDRGGAVRRFADRARRNGKRHVEMLFVNGARHETLNEIDRYRDLAMRSLIAFLERNLENSRGEALS